MTSRSAVECSATELYPRYTYFEPEITFKMRTVGWTLVDHCHGQNYATSVYVMRLLLGPHNFHAGFQQSTINHLQILHIFNRFLPAAIVAKVIFLHLSVILFTGGLPQCMLGYHTPPDQADPPPGSRLQHTVYERPVRILLECILVNNLKNSTLFFKYFYFVFRFYN